MKIKYQIIEKNRMWTLQYRYWYWPFWRTWSEQNMPYLFDTHKAAREFVETLERIQDEK